MQGRKENRNEQVKLEKLYLQAIASLKDAGISEENTLEHVDAYLTALQLCGEQVNQGDVLSALELLQAAILLPLYEFYSGDCQNGASDADMEAREKARKDYTCYVKAALNYYNMAVKNKWHFNTIDSRLGAAVTVAALYEERYLETEFGHAICFDGDYAAALLLLIDGIEPENDRQRASIAFVYRTLHYVYREKLDIDKSFAYAMKALQCYMYMHDMNDTVLISIASMFVDLREAFSFDSDMRKLFEFAAEAFTPYARYGSLETLASIIWKYNTDFSGMSPAKQQALLTVLDMIKSCVDRGKFSHDVDGERLSDFPENAFREEMDDNADGFVSLYERAHASHVDFSRMANQPQLPFMLFLQSQEQSAEIKSLKERVRRMEAQHATMFKPKRDREQQAELQEAKNVKVPRYDLRKRN